MQAPSLIIEFFTGKEFSVPLWEVALLVVINSICLLLGRHRLGLIVTYFFVFYWGFILNRGLFTDMLGNMTCGLYLYGSSGIALGAVFLVSFFVRPQN